MKKIIAIVELKEPGDGKELEVERDIFSQVKVFFIDLDKSKINPVLV
jgi:hypothetical protein